MSLFRKINNYFLGKYSRDDFIEYKKAQFIMIFCIMNTTGMLILLISTLFIFDDPSRKQDIRIAAPTLMTVCIIVLLFLKQKKLAIAANILAFGACLTACGGFFGRAPHVAGVTMGYFMHLDLAYATLFCRTLVSSSILGMMVATHIVYYFWIAKPVVKGLIKSTASSTVFLGPLTLIMLFICALAASSFLQKAFAMSKEESKKNEENYKFIKSMMSTVQETSENLGNSISSTSGVITQFTDNSQSQAASVEELSATMEEISASTHNVSEITSDQSNSLKELVSSIDTLSMSVDLMENYSNEIAQAFISFMELTKHSNESSNKLEQTNSQIYENSEEILSVITIMEDFFDHINLLSLNAAIEAARAGEYGRGFAVVSEEIGKLSETTSQDLMKISQMIEKNKRDVEEGSRIITDILNFIRELLTNFDVIKQLATDALQEVSDQKKIKDTMNDMTRSVIDQAENINFLMTDQKDSIDNVVISIENTNRIVQNNTENTEKLRDQSERLQKMSDNLKSHFIKDE